jgi:hypothetical protein
LSLSKACLLCLGLGTQKYKHWRHESGQGKTDDVADSAVSASRLSPAILNVRRLDPMKGEVEKRRAFSYQPRFPATTMRLDSYIAFMNGRLNHVRIPMP